MREKLLNESITRFINLAGKAMTLEIENSFGNSIDTDEYYNFATNACAHLFMSQLYVIELALKDSSCSKEHIQTAIDEVFTHFFEVINQFDCGNEYVPTPIMTFRLAKLEAKLRKGKSTKH